MTDQAAETVKFEYTGQTGQKVGFGLVETGDVYDVQADRAAILEGDSDFKKLTGKAAEAATPVGAGWPEAPTEPAGASTEPSEEEPAEEAPPVNLDHAIISFTAPAPAPAPRGGRGRVKSK